jgi:hypothetical protein
VGIAEDEDTIPGGDWAHENVIARYLAVQLSVSLVTVDYSGITIRGECDELLYDTSLAWVEYLLMALDAMLAGTHTFQNVSKEQVLAFLEVFTVLENTRQDPATEESSLETILLDLGNGYTLRYSDKDLAEVPYICVNTRGCSRSARFLKEVNEHYPLQITCPTMIFRHTCKNRCVAASSVSA